MAVRIQGTTVIDDSRNLTNLNDFSTTGDVSFSGTDSIQVPSGTTAERPVSPNVGEIRFNTDEGSLEKYDGVSWSLFTAQSGDLIAGSLDKTFTSDETVDITLSRSAGVAPAVSVVKEVPQTGIISNDWDVAADGSNFTLHDTAYDTTLIPSNATGNGTFTLGSGSFSSEDVGKRIVGNGGEAILTATDGSYELQSAFNDSSTIAAGDWSMFALDVESPELGLKLSGLVSGSTLSTNDVFSDNSIIATYQLDGNANDLGGSYNAVSTSNLTYTSGLFNQSAVFNGTDSLIELPISIVPSSNAPRSISLWSKLNSSSTGDRQVLYGSGTHGSTRKAFDFEANAYQTTGKYGIHLWSAGTGTNADVIYDQWVHLVLVHDGGDISPSNTRIYVNNVSYSVNSTESFDTSNADVHEIGLRTQRNDIPVDGEIDQVRLFDRSLSAGEVEVLYNEEPITFATDNNHTAITTLSTDTEFWNDINSMTADDASNDGSVYYAVSTDDRTTWSIIDDTNGVRDIVRNNSGTWEYNSNTTYGSETWTAATENDEFSALEEAATVTTNRMDATQLNAVSDANHYTLGNDLDLAITLFMADGGSTSPTSDGVSINYDVNASDKLAVPSTDYTYDVLDETTVRFTALSDENFKIRVS